MTTPLPDYFADDAIAHAVIPLRGAFRWVGLLWVVVCLVVPVERAVGQIPVIGVPVPELSELDTKMTALMTSQQIFAASLTVSYQGTVVFHHAYGWQDREKLQPLRPDTLFRVASCTKPITAAAIRKLIEDGKLTLGTKVFSMGVPGAGVLDHLPFGTPPANLGDITIEHLLQHRGGWNRGLVPDLTYLETPIATAMGVPSPPGPDNTVRYIMGQPLQHVPGSTYAYANTGYFLLGLIIEKASGQSYASYVQEKVIGPGGSAADQWTLSRSLQADQHPREPVYDDTTLLANVFYPAHSASVKVLAPYGSFDMEARTGQGRIATNGLVLVRYLDRYQTAGDDIGRARPAAGAWSWTHTGAQRGTEALMTQRGNGLSYAVIFNKWKTSGNNLSQTIGSTLNTYFSTSITWPTRDITQVQPVIPAVTLGASASSLSFPTEEGRHYQCQRSTDMVVWQDHRHAVVGNGAVQTIAPEATGPKAFYRIVVR